MEPSPASPFTWLSCPFGPALESRPLASVAIHRFTTRSLTLGGPQASADFARLATAVGVATDRLARLKQVHGTDVFVVRRRASLPAPDVEEAWPRADIILTDAPDTAIAVQVADCVPVLLADRRSGAVGGVHAGWRGTAARVVQRAVAAMREHFGTRPSDLVAAIGPAIGACCYQVGPDVLDAFRSAGFERPRIDDWFRAEEGSDRLRLDVPRANRDQLIHAGVDPSDIAACGLCTACHPSLFFSYRRDGAGTGRLAGVIRTR